MPQEKLKTIYELMQELFQDKIFNFFRKLTVLTFLNNKVNF